MTRLSATSGQLFDDGVDVGGAHPYAHAVEGGVGAAGDDDRQVFVDGDPVAVPPDLGVGVEVAGPVTDAVGVVDEVEGHGRQRRGHHQLALFTCQGASVGIPRGQRDAERGALDPARSYGQQGGTAGEYRADVGTAADRLQPDVRCEPVVDPTPGAGREGRSGLEYGAQSVETELGRGMPIRFLHGGEVGRAHADHGGAGLLGDLPGPVDVRKGGAAVVQDDRAAVQQAADQEVPDHPARGSEEEVAVVGAQIGA